MTRQYIEAPSQTKKTIGTTFQLIKLPSEVTGGELLSIRRLPEYTIRLASVNPYNFDAETMQVFAVDADGNPATVTLDVRTPLTFRDTASAAADFTVRVGRRLNLTATDTDASPATMDIYTGGLGDSVPTLAEVVSTHEASHNGAVFIHGTTSAIPTPNRNPVDTSGYTDGVGMTQTIVENSFTFACRFNLRYGDIGSEEIQDIIYSSTRYDLEVYLILVYSDGERHEGYCKVLDATPEAELKNIRALSFNAQIQGETYIRTPSPEAVQLLALI